MNKWWVRAQEWLIPGRCVLCLGRAAGEVLCAGCLQDLPWIQAGCVRCGVTLGAPGTCPACQRRPPPWDGALVACRYQEPARSLVLRLKYRGALACGTALGAVLAARVAAAGSTVDLLVPVPLHRQRLRERGFNQAAVIALEAGRRLGIEVAVDAAARPQPTPRQARARSVGERRRNLAGAFIARPGRVEGRRVAVVDDVLTTGSTVAGLGRALAAAGAARVDAWVCCRAETAPESAS